MQEELLASCGGNLITIGVALILFVVWKRCTNSKCAIHSAWVDCESPEIKQIKFEKNKTLLKQALNEINNETARESINNHV